MGCVIAAVLVADKAGELRANCPCRDNIIHIVIIRKWSVCL